MDNQKMEQTAEQTLADLDTNMKRLHEGEIEYPEWQREALAIWGRAPRGCNTINDLHRLTLPVSPEGGR